MKTKVKKVEEPKPSPKAAPEVFDSSLAVSIVLLLFLFCFIVVVVVVVAVSILFQQQQLLINQLGITVIL